MMPAKSGREEMPANGSDGIVVLLVPIFVEDGRRRGELGAGGEAHDADLVGVDAPFLGVGADDADGLLGVVNGVDLGNVAVGAQPVPEDDGVDAVVVEEGDEVGGLAADVQGPVAAPGDDDDRGAGVDGLLHHVDFDGGVVDGDDAADAAGDGLAHVVDLGHVELVGLEVGRARREERHDDAAGQDGLGGIGLAGVGGRPGYGLGRRERGQRGLRLGDRGGADQGAGEEQSRFVSSVLSPCVSRWHESHVEFAQHYALRSYLTPTDPPSEA